MKLKSFLLGLMAFLFMAASAHAATINISLYFDSDGVTTGPCTVVTPSGTVAGIDYLLQLTADDTAGTVGAATLSQCVAGVLTPLPGTAGAWTLTPQTAYNLLQGQIPLSAFPGGAPVGVLVASQVNGAFVNLVGGAGGGFAQLPPFGPNAAAAAGPTPVPVNAPWALLLLAAVVLATGGCMAWRRRAGHLMGITLVTVCALAASLNVYAQISGTQLFADSPGTLAPGGVQAISIRSDGKMLYLDIQLAKSNPCSSNPDVLCDPPEDSLPAMDGMVVSAFIGGTPAGLPYKSTAADGSVFSGKTSANGEFYAFAGGKTEFTIGNVNLGNWYEPQTLAKSSSARLKMQAAQPSSGSSVQLDQLSFGQTSCSTASALATVQIFLGLNTSQNPLQVVLPNTPSLTGCPDSEAFFANNSINTTVGKAANYIIDLNARNSLQKNILALLFGVAPEQSGYPKVSRDYGVLVKGYGKKGSCDGYEGGHGGVDMVASPAAAPVYALTGGTVKAIDYIDITTSDATYCGHVVIEPDLPFVDSNGNPQDMGVGYMHLSRIDVKKDTHITRGQQIGLQGSTWTENRCRSSGPHVHFEIRPINGASGACGVYSTVAPPDGRALPNGGRDPYSAYSYFASILSGGMPPCTGNCYLDENGARQTLPATVTPTGLKDGGAVTLENDRWYICPAGETVTYTDTMMVESNAHLILADGCKMTVNSSSDAAIKVEAGNSLTIYAQSTSANMGSLTASSMSEGAGIGGGKHGSGGNITINGGRISASSGAYGAGIGGGDGGAGGAITINGGMVSAIGNHGGAGIGGGVDGAGGAVRITGSSYVIAKGGNGADNLTSGFGGGAGIGSGGSSTATPLSAGTFSFDYSSTAKYTAEGGYKSSVVPPLLVSSYSAGAGVGTGGYKGSNNKCSPNQVLQNGVCTTTPTTCPSGQTLQNGVCTATPPTSCPSGETLQNGVCTTTPTTCPTGQTLQNGVCVSNSGGTVYTQVSAGYIHTCGLTSSGGVKCWGTGSDGRLGTGNLAVSTNVPVDVTGLASGVEAISAGAFHTCALMSPASGGGVKCWGWNSNGQLGNGTVDSAWTPVDVQDLPVGVSIKAISAGQAHTCALTSQGGVWCWGRNDSGQLGDNTTQNRLKPTSVYGLGNGSNVDAISAGYYDTCALIGGKAKCWGQIWVDFSWVLNQLTPVTMKDDTWLPDLSSGVTAISAGFESGCALIGGSVTCWGRAYPPVSGHVVQGVTSDVKTVSAANYWDNFCALTNGGGVKCWGRNESGEVGDSTTEVRYSAVDVTNLTSGVTDISAGGTHACAVKQGSVWCWGANSSGQLGNGTGISNSPVPVQVVDSGGTSDSTSAR